MSTLTTYRELQHLLKGDTVGGPEKMRNLADAFDAAAPYILGANQAIDAKSGGNTTLYTVPSGKSMIPWMTILRPVTIAAPTANPFMSMGTNATSYDDIITNSQFDLGVATQGYRISHDTGLSPYGAIFAAGTAIVLKVNTPATGTTYTIAAYLLGMLV